MARKERLSPMEYLEDESKIILTAYNNKRKTTEEANVDSDAQMSRRMNKFAKMSPGKDLTVIVTNQNGPSPTPPSAQAPEPLPPSRAGYRFACSWTTRDTEIRPRYLLSPEFLLSMNNVEVSVRFRKVRVHSSATETPPPGTKRFWTTEISFEDSLLSESDNFILHSFLHFTRNTASGLELPMESAIPEKEWLPLEQEPPQKGRYSAIISTLATVFEPYTYLKTPENQKEPSISVRELKEVSSFGAYFEEVIGETSDEYDSDITILAGEEEKPFYCHKFVLKAKIREFMSMIPECDRVIHLKSHSVEAVRTTLKFLYTCELDGELNDKAAFGVLRLAKEMKFDKLIEKCEATMVAKLNSGNITENLWIIMNFDFPQLKHQCEVLMLKLLTAKNLSLFLIRANTYGMPVLRAVAISFAAENFPMLKDSHDLKNRLQHHPYLWQEIKESAVKRRVKPHYSKV